MRLKKTSKLYLAKLMMILVLLSGFCIDTIAQTIVSGKVTNQKDNSSIEGISINIKGTEEESTELIPLKRTDIPPAGSPLF